MEPVVHGFGPECSGGINFAFLNAEDPAAEPFKRDFGFRVQPEFYLLDGQGQVAKEWAGYILKMNSEPRSISR
jgi:hypothetical protein